MEDSKTHQEEFCLSYPFPFQQSVKVVGNDTDCFEMAQNVAKKVEHKKDWDESFFVCDIGRILDQYKRFKEELPRVNVCYAIKANSLQPIVSTMTALGCGFDCASKNEISMALRSGVDPDKIIFAHTCKFSSHILFAKEKGVKTMVFDNEEELYKTKELYPEARLLLRIRTREKDVRKPFGSKFGATLEDSKGLLQTARKLELNVIGVSFHVGCGCFNADSFNHAIKDSKQIFDFACDVGYKFNLLDIGGGFPGSETENSVVPFTKMARIIRESLDDNFPPESDVKFVSEPGRYFPGPAMALVTNVVGKKVMDGCICYYVGDGVYNSFCNVLDNAKYSARPLHIVKGVPRQSKLYGISLDGSDVITKSVLMPEVDLLSWIYWKVANVPHGYIVGVFTPARVLILRVFLEMGSYAALTQFGFNGFVTYKAFHFITESKLEELKSTAMFPSLLPCIECSKTDE